MFSRIVKPLDVVKLEDLHPSIDLTGNTDYSPRTIPVVTIESQTLSLLNTIGQGQHATVWLARSMESGIWYALKVLDNGEQQGQREADNLAIASQLVTTLRPQRSPRSKVTSILMNLAKGITLTELASLIQQKRFPAQSSIEYCHMAISLTEQLKKLHDANIAHNNLKPQKIFYDPLTRQMTITSFGHAKTIRYATSREYDLFSLYQVLTYMFKSICDEQSHFIQSVLDSLQVDLPEASEILARFQALNDGFSIPLQAQYKTGVVDIAEYQSQTQTAIQEMENKFCRYNEIILVDSKAELQNYSQDYLRLRQHLVMRTQHPAICPEVLRFGINNWAEDFMRYRTARNATDSRIREYKHVTSDFTEHKKWAESVICEGHDPRTSLSSINNRNRLYAKRKHEESFTTATEQSISQTASQRGRQ